MSKKSTGSNRSDGDAEYTSAKGRNYSNDKGKCSTQPRLFDKQEVTSGDESYKNTPSSSIYKSSRNYVENLITKPHHKSSPDSIQSSNETLYGTSDEFNKKLEALRQKLCILKVYDTGAKVHEPLTSQNTHQRLDAPFDRHSCTTESSCDSKSDYKEKPKGYLSTRETYINLLSPLPKCKEKEILKTECQQNSDLTTIYKAVQFNDTDNSNSEDSYKVPLKKLCRGNDLRSQTNQNTLNSSTSKDVIEVLPKNTRLCCTVSSPNTCVVSPLKYCSPKNIHLPEGVRTTGTGINYAVPLKRICIRNTAPTFINKFPKVIEKVENSLSNSSCKHCGSKNNITLDKTSPAHIKPPSEGDDDLNATWSDCSKNSISKNKIESLNSSDVELSLNLSSSRIGDYTSSSKKPPLEPKIKITNAFRNQFKRKNRITPISECTLSSTTVSSPETYENEKNLKDLYRKEVNLYKKYYEDISDMSSNSDSTITLRVSTCGSQTSSLHSPSKEINSGQTMQYCKTFKENKLEIILENDAIPNFVDPMLSSSLDIPKLFMHVYNFPAITKITGFCGNLAEDSCLGDFFREDLEEKSANLNCYFNSSLCYKSMAESLLNSPNVSPLRNTWSYKDVTEYGDSKTKPILQDYTYKRKEQSTKMSFYSLPSTALNEEFNETNVNNDDSLSETIVDENETCPSCCFGIFFPRKGKRFFT